MEVILVLLLIVLVVRWFVIKSRLDELQARIAAQSGDRLDAMERQQIVHLTERVFELEKTLRNLQTSPPPPAAQPVHPAAPTSQPAAPPPLPVVRPPAPAPRPSAEPPPLPQGPPPLPQVPQFTPGPAWSEPTGPTLTDRVRKKVSGKDWEAIVGGNWLLKLGVLVLVIGIALFLAYSFTQMGPAGRAGISLAVSLAMLIGGVFVEQREAYRLFGRGLIGGGWAALYITVYAMQALDAARIIQDPLLGALLLLAVASGMIVHSLKYQSQTVTGLAYFVAFISLAITSVTPLSVIALIPLAASLLYVAYRFAWSEMALFGLIATYGTCALRGDSGAPLWSAQVLFSVYWLLFEVFDLLRAARRSDRPAERALMPLNALGFAGLSYAKWSKAAPEHLYLLAAGIAAAYLLSSVLRTRLRPPSSFTPETDAFHRAFAGGYEGPITVTAILSAAAVLLKFHSAWANAGLFIEAELFFLAALFFGETYPRRLAAALFATGIGRLLILDLPVSDRTTVIGWSIRHWTPSAAFAGVLFYVNRCLRAANVGYGYAATAVFTLIIGYETPERFMGLGLVLFAALVFAVGWQRRLFDFRIQGYCVASIGFMAIAVHHARVEQGLVPPYRHPWIMLAFGAVLAYAAVLSTLRSGVGRFHDDERDGLKFLASWVTTGTLMALVWRILPAQLLGLGWMALALPILELGIRRTPREFQIQSYVVAAAGASYALYLNALPISNDAPMFDRLLVAAAAGLAYLMAARVWRAGIPSRRVVDVASAAGTAFLLTALWALLPSVVVGPAWALVAFILLEIGLAIDFPGVRTQGHIVGGVAFGRLLFANLDTPQRLITVLPVIASHYYQWVRQRQAATRLLNWERGFGRAYLYSAAVLMTVLLRFQLGRGFTVIGWALFVLALVAVGQRLDIKDLRWQSYALAALTFLWSWSTNEGIATGAFVIACFFAAQLLLPQPKKEGTTIERYARPFYSLLATVLLTILLFHEVSGRLLTMAWGLEGLALLTAGFPLSDRTLRLSGLTLFMVCILKLFLYDLRQLETLYRILSFIVLGLILVAVSWAYTRFRDRVKRYL